MEGNIGELGQYIGVGLTAIGMGGAAIGVGNVAGNFLSGSLRNPSAAGLIPVHPCGGVGVRLRPFVT